MNEETAKAINALSNKVNDMIERLDNFLVDKHNENKQSIEDTDMAVMELAELISKEEEKVNG